MKKFAYSFAIIAVLLLLSEYPAFALSTSEALSASQVSEIILNTDPVGYNPPYDRSDFAAEYIEPMQGSLYLTEDILYLPGKNGLDVKLSCSYNSNSIGTGFSVEDTRYVNTYEKHAYYYSYDNNGTKETILICPDNEEAIINLGDGGFYVRAIPSTTYEDIDGVEYYRLSSFNTDENNIYLSYEANLAPKALSWQESTKLRSYSASTEVLKFADIWNWKLPVIVETINPCRYNSDDTYKYYSQETMFVDLDGDYCNIEFAYTKKTSNGNLSDVSVTVSNSKGEYTGVYTTKDIVDDTRGITYHCSITDAQGRTMFFTEKGLLCAVEDRFGNIVKYTFEYINYEHGRLLEITDTLGRKVSLSYTDNDVLIYVSEDGVTPRLYAEFRNTCQNSTYDINNYFVADNSYTSKIIRYEDSDTPYIKTFNYVKWHQAWYISTRYYEHEPVECNVMLSVEQPNGIKTEYSTQWNKYSCDGHQKKIYSYTERYDKDNASVYNKYTYAYSSGTSTVVTRDGDETTVTYEGDGVVEIKTTAYQKEKLIEDPSYKKANGKRRLSYTKQTYYEGNKSGDDRIVYTSLNALWQNSKVAYDDYEKNITYHDSSNFVESVVYNQSEDVYVKTTYTLSQEGDDYYTGRVVDSATVWESTDGGDTYTEKYTVLYTYNPDGTLASETTDPDGINQVTSYTYTYGTDGSITTTATMSNLKDADGNSIAPVSSTVKVDSQGRVLYTTDPNGNTTSYEYDLIGRVVKVTNPDNTTQTYEYDTLNRTVIATNEDGIMEMVQYDGFGNIIATYKNIGTTAAPSWAKLYQYEYDALCRPATTYEYTSHDGTTPTKWVKTVYSYGAYDSVSQVITYDETETELTNQTYTYNTVDRPTTLASVSKHDKANNGTYYRFTSVTVETAPKDGITPPTVKQFFDRQGRIVKQIRTDGDDEYLTTYTYDAVGNVLEVKDETAYADYDVDFSAKYEYNYSNQVVKAYNAEGNYAEFAYDTLGRQLSASDYEGNAVNYTYDSIGRLLTESAPVDDGVTSLSKYYYDGNSNLTKAVVSTASGDVEYTYLYDNMGRLLSAYDGSTYSANIYRGTKLVKSVYGLSEYTTDAYELTPLYHGFNVVDYTYDNMGNLATETAYNGTTTYTYDVAGKVLTATDPKGTVTTNTYDSRGNVLTSTADDDVISYTYNAFNLVTGASRNGIATTYTYDNFGRNTAETTGTKAITRSYNTKGQVVAMSLTEGETVLQGAEYEYNILGNMTSATDGHDTVTYNYNLNGFPITEEKDGLITEYAYTPGNLIKSATHTRRRVNDPTDEEGYNDILNISSFVYTYYPDGNVSTVTDTRGSTAYNTSYVYDSANRLTSASITNGDAVVRSWQYGYNNRGDRTSQIVTDAEGIATSTTYAYANHRLVSETTGDAVTTYTYDANGNTLTKTSGSSTTQYTYTPRNEVATVTTDGITYSYAYNASSLRTSKTVGDATTQFIWAGSNIIREEAADTATEYFYGINRVSRTVTGDAYTYDVSERSYDEEGNRVTITTPVDGYREFYAYDGRGNVMHTLNPEIIDLYISPNYNDIAAFPEIDLTMDGTIDLLDINLALGSYPIVQNYYYSPFGEVWQGEKANDTNNFRYAGEYHDAETGSIYLRARYYNPSTGRFITVDPIKDGTNWYVYCNNNPIMFVDPWGLDCYIICGREQAADCDSFYKQLQKEYPAEPIHYIIVDSEEEFVNAWNNMGIVDGEEVPIDVVIICVHGDEDLLVVENDIVDLEQLDKKPVNVLFLFSCNTGNVDCAENVASIFAKEKGCKYVIAPDGDNVRGYEPGSLDAECAANLTIEYSKNGPRVGNGFCLYTIHRGSLYITKGLTKDFEAVNISELLKISEKAIANLPKNKRYPIYPYNS